MAKKKKAKETSDTNVRLQQTTVDNLHIIKEFDGKHSLDRVVQELITFKYPDGLPK